MKAFVCLLTISTACLLALGCGATQETKDLSHAVISPGGMVDQRLHLDDKIITTYRDLLEANKEAVPELTMVTGQVVSTQEVIDALDTILTTTTPIQEGTHALDKYTQSGTNAMDMAKDLIGHIDILSSITDLFGK